MSKLIETYRKCPTPSNRAKLQTYLQKHMMAACMATTPEEIAFLKHMMAACMATPEEIAFLKANEFKV